MIEKTLNKKKAIKIKWDVDNEEDLEMLPTEIEIPNGMEDEEEISDYLSDVTGFCHNGFCLSDDIEIEEASDAVEHRNVPKEPINVYNNFGEGCLSCPCCKQPIVSVWTKASHMPKNCHYCGQRFLWKNKE